MTRRTQEDWQKLIEQQTISRLTIAEFCKHHELAQSYFYKRKNELKKSTGSPKNTAFLKVSKPIVNSSQSTSIKLAYQQAEINFPVDISPVWLAEFIKALA